MAAQAETDFLDPNNWIRAKQLAAILHCNPQSIYNTISVGGDLPRPYKRGGKTLFFRPEVEQWLRSGRIERAVR